MLQTNNYGTAYNIGYNFEKDFLLEGHRNFYTNFTSKQSKGSNAYWFKFAGCFSIFFSDYANAIRDKNVIPEFYFMFQTQPYWIGELIRRFNLKFKNIDIEIIQNYDSKIIKKIDDYDGILRDWVITDNDAEFKTVEKYIKTSCPLYTIRTQGYDIQGAKYIYYLVHHYLRLLSNSEKFINLDFEKPEKDLLKTVFNINNTHLLATSFKGSYRGLSEIIQPHTSFYSLDDVESVNCFANKLSNIITTRQTGAIYWINKIYNNKDIFINEDNSKLEEYLKSRLWIYIQRLSSGNSDVRSSIFKINNIEKKDGESPIYVKYDTIGYAISTQRGCEKLEKLSISKESKYYQSRSSSNSRTNLTQFMELDDFIEYNTTKENAEELRKFIQDNIQTKEEEN